MKRPYSARREFWIAVGGSLLLHAVIVGCFLGWPNFAESPPAPVDVEWTWAAPTKEPTAPLRKESLAGTAGKLVPATPPGPATVPAQAPVDPGGGTATQRGRTGPGDKMESRPLAPTVKDPGPAASRAGSGSGSNDAAAPPASPGLSEEGGSTGYALTPPRLKERPPIQWPPNLSSAGPLQVLLLVEVTEDGRVGKIGVSRSSGVKALDDAARGNVARWRFDPAWQPQGNKPVRVLTSVWIRYTGEGG
jgi:TonB family protein